MRRHRIWNVGESRGHTVGYYREIRDLKAFGCLLGLLFLPIILFCTFLGDRYESMFGAKVRAKRFKKEQEEKSRVRERMVARINRELDAEFGGNIG